MNEQLFNKFLYNIKVECQGFQFSLRKSLGVIVLRYSIASAHLIII